MTSDRCKIFAGRALQRFCNRFRRAVFGAALLALHAYRSRRWLLAQAVDWVLGTLFVSALTSALVTLVRRLGN